MTEPDIPPTREHARSEAEIMELILSFARDDERIRLVGMEGSRLDPDAPRDAFQDYDVSYLVTEMESFTRDDGWLARYGNRIMMQKPEAMSLFPPELGGWFSYLMLFEDGNRIDLKLIPMADLNAYLASEPRLSILLDKDRRLDPPAAPSGPNFLFNRPSIEFYDDCCNEFWWVTTYVAKGLARNELLYAADHLNRYVRPSLMRMLTWEALFLLGLGAIAPGKSYKYLPRYLADGDMEHLMRTFNNGSSAKIWESLSICCDLFRKASKEVGEASGFSYPPYDGKVTPYMEDIRNRYTAAR